MWERKTKIFDKQGNYVGEQIESGESWYDIILDLPDAIKVWWHYMGFFMFFIPLIIPIVCIHNAIERRQRKKQEKIDDLTDKRELL